MLACLLQGNADSGRRYEAISRGHAKCALIIGSGEASSRRCHSMGVTTVTRRPDGRVLSPRP